MARITAPVSDFTGKVAGVDFVDGVAQTEDPGALAYFFRQGYTVVDEGEPEPDFPDGAPADSWTVKQLTAYAKAKGIDLGEAKKKDEILAALAPADADLADGPAPKVGHDGIPVLADPAQD